MKKILIIVSLLTFFSCSYQTQKVKLDLSFDDEKSNIGNGLGIQVVAFDERLEKEFVGTKKIGDEKVKIVIEQNLPELLQSKIKENLLKKGFKIGKDKLVEIHVESLSYKAKRQFFISTSNASGNIKIVVKNYKNNEKFTKNFDLSLKRKHFIMPLESTDSKTINAILKEIVEDILNDESFIKNLSNQKK
jgi:uncharacterized lipoprotein YajG